jgi:hypothetical protein
VSFLVFIFCLHLVALIEGEVDYMVLTFYITLLVDVKGQRDVFFSQASSPSFFHPDLLTLPPKPKKFRLFPVFVHYMNFEFLML